MVGIISRQVFEKALQLACNQLVFTSWCTLTILRSFSSTNGTVSTITCLHTTRADLYISMIMAETYNVLE